MTDWDIGYAAGRFGQHEIIRRALEAEFGVSINTADGSVDGEPTDLALSRVASLLRSLQSDAGQNFNSKLKAAEQKGQAA